MIHVCAFLVKKTSGILFFGPSFRYFFLLFVRKLGPKNKIPEVLLTKKAQTWNYVVGTLYFWVSTTGALVAAIFGHSLWMRT